MEGRHATKKRRIAAGSQLDRCWPPELNESDGYFFKELFHGATMTQIEAIQAEIEALTSEDFDRLRDWIAERDWQRWDRQIEQDSAAGKLDFLREEVEAAKQRGALREI